MREVDAVRLGDEPKELPVSVEGPWPTRLDDFQRGLPIPVKKNYIRLSGGVFVSEFDCRRTVPLNVDYRDEAIGQDPPDGGTSGEILELGHSLPGMAASIWKLD